MPIALIACVCAAATGFLVSSGRPQTYEVRATVTENVPARPVALTPGQELATRQRLGLFADVARSRPLLQSVIERLSLDLPASVLVSRIRSQISDDGSLLIVQARDRDPNLAAALANAVAEEIVRVASLEEAASPTLAGEIDAQIATSLGRFRSWRERAERLTALETRKRGQERRLRSLRAGIADTLAVSSLLLPFSSASSSSELSIVDHAAVPMEPVEPRPLLDGLLAGILAIFLVLPFAFIPHFLDRVVRDRDDLLEASGIRAVTTVPPIRGAWLHPLRVGREAWLVPGSAATDAYRTVRWAIEPFVTGKHCRTLLLAGPRRSDGSSVVAANLAAVFAHGGRRVVLVDADIDAPKIHQILELPASGGLASALAIGADPDASMCAGPIAGIDVLAGQPGGHLKEHIASPEMRILLGRLKASHDVIIVVSPPLLESGAAETLAPMADAVILVVDAGRARRDDIRAAAHALSVHRSRVLGAVIIHLPPRILVSITRHLPLPHGAAARPSAVTIRHGGS